MGFQARSFDALPDDETDAPVLDRIGVPGSPALPEPAWEYHPENEPGRQWTTRAAPDAE